MAAATPSVQVVCSVGGGSGGSSLLLTLPPSPYAASLLQQPARLLALQQQQQQQQQPTGGGRGASGRSSSRNTGRDPRSVQPPLLLCSAAACTPRQYLFNAAEGLQRHAADARVRLGGVSTLFCTRLHGGAAGGLSGLVYALADRGAERLEVYGPRGCGALLGAMRAAYLRRRHPEVASAEFSGSLGESWRDEDLVVVPVLLETPDGGDGLSGAGAERGEGEGPNPPCPLCTGEPAPRPAQLTHTPRAQPTTNAPRRDRCAQARSSGRGPGPQPEPQPEQGGGRCPPSPQRLCRGRPPAPPRSRAAAQQPSEEGHGEVPARRCRSATSATSPPMPRRGRRPPPPPWCRRHRRTATTTTTTTTTTTAPAPASRVATTAAWVALRRDPAPAGGAPAPARLPAPVHTNMPRPVSHPPWKDHLLSRPWHGPWAAHGPRAETMA
jgi:hypothetical protein